MLTPRLLDDVDEKHGQSSRPFKLIGVSMHDSATLASLAGITFLFGLAYAVWQLLAVIKAQRDGEHSALARIDRRSE